jgi:hypothetical protein
MLKFKKITVVCLRAACTKTHNMILRGQWTNSQGSCYLKTEGMMQALVDQIVNHASGIQDKILTAMSGNAAEVQAFTDALAQDPYITKQLPDPSTWNYPHTDISDYIDTIMHQLFLGVTKTLYKSMILLWMKSHGKGAPYLRSLSEPLKRIESLQLSWAKAKQVGESGKFGGIVSENYVFLARASKWLHAGIGNLPATDGKYQDPDRAKKEYTSTQIKDWFKHRNLPYTKDLNAAGTKAVWLTYLATLGDQEPPPIVEDDSEKIPGEVVESLITSLLPMLSRVMLSGPITEAQILDVERHIKLFLSCVENFDGYRTKREKPLWASSYNFISLLNLPSLLRRYGSLRMLWEGDGKGEGALRLLKRLITNGLKGNWAFCTALRYLKEKAMTHMLRASVDATNGRDTENRQTVKQMLKVAKTIFGNEYGDDADEDVDDINDENVHQEDSPLHANTGTRFGDYNAYTDIHQVRQELSKRDMPISVVALEDDQQFAVVLQGGTSYVCLIRKEFKKTVCGASYFGWSVKDTPTNYRGVLWISHYCLLLPLGAVLKGNNEDGFYLITSNWKEMLDDGAIDYSRVPHALYSY